MSARGKLIASLRRTGTGHTGMGASALVDDFAHELAERLRAAGYAEAADLIEPGPLPCEATGTLDGSPVKCTNVRGHEERLHEDPYRGEWA